MADKFGTTKLKKPSSHTPSIAYRQVNGETPARGAQNRPALPSLRSTRPVSAQKLRAKNVRLLSVFAARP
jgi:hypothetical protein